MRYQYEASFECVCRETGVKAFKKVVAEGEGFAEACAEMSAAVDIIDGGFDVVDIAAMIRLPLA
ncbi:MAG: hypothetical protein AB9Q19_00425 [Candidatus Reddybacter sp.]